MTAKQSIGLVLLCLGIVAYSCKDMGNQPPPNPLTASAFSIALATGATSNITISGGTPPYRISKQPSATLATATLVNNANNTATLTIQATSSLVSGRDSVVIKDTDSHGGSIDSPTHSENEITIYILINPPAGTVFYSSQVQPIFTNNCVGCHTPGGQAPFSLQAGVSRGNIVNVQATSSCTSDKRVLPGNSASSVLYKKVSGNTCGARMPMGGTPLSQSDIGLIRDWIDQGAENN